MGVLSLTYEGVESITKKSTKSLQKKETDRYYEKYFLYKCEDCKTNNSDREYLFLKYVNPMQCLLVDYVNNSFRGDKEIRSKKFDREYRVIEWECDDIKKTEDADCCDWNIIQW